MPHCENIKVHTVKCKRPSSYVSHFNSGEVRCLGKNKTTPNIFYFLQLLSFPLTICLLPRNFLTQSRPQTSTCLPRPCKPYHNPPALFLLNPYKKIHHAQHPTGSPRLLICYMRTFLLDFAP